METATIDLIICVVVLLLYVVLPMIHHYYKIREKKDYELLEALIKGVEIFSAISISWLLLDIFKDGHDSSTGWWALFFLIAGIICGIVSALVNRICNNVWPRDKEDFSPKSKVMIPKSLRICTQLLGIVFCIATAGILLGAFGIYYSSSELMKCFKNK